MADSADEKEHPEPPAELGAAFQAILDPAAVVGPGITVTPGRTPDWRTPGIRRGGLGGVPADEWPESDDGENQLAPLPPRTLTVQRSGDDEVDAMLMLRALFDGVTPRSHRRLIDWLTDRYL